MLAPTLARLAGKYVVKTIATIKGHDKTSINWLVVLTILKNMKVNGKDYSIYYEK
jgi:hypothetical protein